MHPVRSFFAQSDDFDHFVLRPLTHIRGAENWELSWDAEGQAYVAEDNRLAQLLNELIEELEQSSPPARYHDNEDRLAEFVIKSLKWPIRKIDGRWVGADYAVILEHGGYDDSDQRDLVLAAAGRIRAAFEANQHHFDDMEESHRRMLAAVISVILYHRL